MTNAGIPGINVVVTGGFTPVTDLIDLVGATSFQDDNPETLGFLVDILSSSFLIKGGYLDSVRIIRRFSPNITPAYSVNTGTTFFDGSFVDDSLDHWLVKPAAQKNSKRVYFVSADQYLSMELIQNERTRVSASEIFEFGIASKKALVNGQQMEKLSQALEDRPSDGGI